ncbi:flagellar basal body P-ring protein FlgI [Buchnera aphidicola]|uniref:Flagellar P-ring protein, partial n=1 Tax=Buchnera aphidicola (Cinara curvipes) TaxID=2518975 RepID=A0A451D6N9_9GAMM|nr:flagellar basal body P-ring protein FlgI [Buchnera aphidicola]VFP81511.1 Flagellar P-ring protein [Buchnera aphidicola (Cinara curvipes)]
MKIIPKFKYIIIILYILLNNKSLISAKKIYNLINIVGIQDTQLIGYGLVVGLNGTGDTTAQIPFTYQSLNNMLIKFGIYTKNSQNIQTKNTAAVIVTTTISPLNYIGQKIDITVSSIGNASNLNGGTLIMTPLMGIDKKTYAIAQGNIPTDLQEKRMYFKKSSKDLLNRKKIIHGAIIKKSTSNKFDKYHRGIIILKSIRNNWSLLKNIRDTINMYYYNIATIIDFNTIQLNVPKNKILQNKILFHIFNIDITSKKNIHKKKYNI